MFTRTKLTRTELARGRDLRYIDTEIPENPAESLAEAIRRIEKAGWGFKTRDDTYNGRKYSITWRNRVALSANWDKYTTIQKASILWHELVHIRQRQHLGHSRFVSRWLLSPFGRWSLETPAYRQSLSAYEVMSRGKFHGTDYADEKVVSMRKDYILGRIDKDQYVRETTAIFYSARIAA
jgi:hypothetical protein